MVYKSIEYNEYIAVHKWARTKLGKPQMCWECGATDGERKYDWANISGEYKRELSDWRRLCRFCHRKLDAKSHCKNGHEFTDANTYTDKNGWRSCLVCRKAATKRSNSKKRLKHVCI